MAFMRATPHYKGRYPVDIGGVTLGGPGPKEVVPDDFAAKLAMANFPYFVWCDRDGKYLVDVPPTEEEKKPAAPIIEPQVEPSKSETEAIREMVADEDTVPSSIEIEPKTKGKKGK